MLTEDQFGAVRLSLASTTTETFVAHEMRKPNVFVCIPKFGASVRITGFGSDHGAVGRPVNIVAQPEVPGK